MICFLAAMCSTDNRKKKSLLGNELEAISENQLRGSSGLEAWNRTQLCSRTPGNDLFCLLMSHF